jgi:pimeloyl-ACP methyl ester carboxylesterase
MDHVETEVLSIAYESGGPQDAPVILLLHGWPDDATTWRKVTPALERAGLRWIAPWLRGFGETKFLSSDACRDGSIAALAKDALDLMDKLRVPRFSVVGHDWGGRVAYALAALVPERLDAIAALSIAYAPKGGIPVPSFKQSRAWWYQWFMSVDRGAEAVRADPVGFARIQWETWSPPGWFTEDAFAETSRSFLNPDWAAITLNAYRSRWREEPRDARYDPLREKMKLVEQLTVPTLMVQGAADDTVLPESTEGKERYFTDVYRRIVLERIGHFPPREAPETVAAEIIELIRRDGARRSG